LSRQIETRKGRKAFFCLPFHFQIQEPPGGRRGELLDLEKE
jgi:hypothetical protein